MYMYVCIILSYTAPLEDSNIVGDHIDGCFLFLFQKYFYIAHKRFLSFSSSERFWYLSRAFLKAFLCVFDNSYLSFLYLEKKIYQFCYF